MGQILTVIIGTLRSAQGACSHGDEADAPPKRGCPLLTLATTPAAKARYVAKLYVNGHFVDRTQGVPLGEGFVAHFNEVFRCACCEGVC